MNKRQRKKLFTGYYRVVSQNPVKHHFFIGEKVKVASTLRYRSGSSIHTYRNDKYLYQGLRAEQVRPIYSKKRPTKDCSPS